MKILREKDIKYIAYIMLLHDIEAEMRKDKVEDNKK
jgi:hypothetical protein